MSYRIQLRGWKAARAECTGAFTNFKTISYGQNMEAWYGNVVEEADMLGLCYKLVDIEWCAEIHPDP